MSGPRAQDSRKSCRSTGNKLLGKLEQAVSLTERGLLFELRACARQVWIGVGAVAIECESNAVLIGRIMPRTPGRYGKILPSEASRISDLLFQSLTINLAAIVLGQ